MTRSAWSTTPVLGILFLASAVESAAIREEYLSDRFDALAVRHSQQWGRLGLDTAAQPTDGRPPSPLRIGETVYAKGIGHHAGGEIVLDLGGRYTRFEALVGVHWQGGSRGSVRFEVLVDGVPRSESRPMSDSDPPQRVTVRLQGARELRLLSRDAGDGIACDMANWAEARLVRDLSHPDVGRATVHFCGAPAPEPSSSVCGFSVTGRSDGPQIAWMERPPACLVSVRPAEWVEITVPLEVIAESLTLHADVTGQGEGEAHVILCLDGNRTSRRVTGRETLRLHVSSSKTGIDHVLRMRTAAGRLETAIRWHGLCLAIGERTMAVRVSSRGARAPVGAAPPIQPALREPIERALIEWDWRMQDGIHTEREPCDYPTAIDRTLDRGTKLLRDLQEAGVSLHAEARRWEALRRARQVLAAAEAPRDGEWESLWRDVHRLRRRIALRNPLFPRGPLAFVKQVPGRFSHQLTQYYGRYARPGGGVFVLERPGESMACRSVTRDLPPGSCQHLDVSFDGNRLLFAFCEAEGDNHYHLCEVSADGTGLRRLTDGPFDDFSPRYLPDGKIVFISTRRLGWHRCGNPGCETYTLAMAEADGSDPHPISYHETHEWDPAVLHDGRIIYTRWDYVDRHAVYYEQLWTVRPDGSGPTAFYGNNTFNPVGIWEAFPVPGSDRLIATAAAHHAMTAGSIILVDGNRAGDGPAAIERLTPDALFPESENRVAPRGWHAPAGVSTPPPVPIEERRWPGHCYRSPFPLSETDFLAAYSYDALIGEPDANPANMWGIYLVDRFGNKELLYRDLNIASLWPVPLRPRARPPALAPSPREAESDEGTFFVQDVHVSAPPLPPGGVKRLRIVQVLPKSTPGINRPTVGLPNASPGKQVLGTVPVESDGSAYFRAPARIPLSFQALDARGRAIQVMRSVTYLQPGQVTSCIGCHEPRSRTPLSGRVPRALARGPSRIEPAPEGSNPLSYPLLVQPVLDARCVRCHGEEDLAGGIDLRGYPQGRYTASYNALAPRVSYSAWGGKPGDFRRVNSEPLSRPGFFGARGSSLTALLDAGHEGVELSAEEWERLTVWMDANALFYGTFDPDDQARQQRGERIAGPGLQ